MHEELKEFLKDFRREMNRAGFPVPDEYHDTKQALKDLRHLVDMANIDAMRAAEATKGDHEH